MLQSKIDLVRERAKASFPSFVRLVQPGRVIGAVHDELCAWMTREDAKQYQLILLPRDHAKSTYAALYCVWEITRDPAIKILLLSSTSNLATKQLKFIKDVLTSPIYRFYWPNMVNVDEGKREKWSETEISVDHPKRKAEYIRDPTVFTAGLTTSITGLHCDLQILDDVVVMENAYTADGREKTQQQYSLLASVASGVPRQRVFGTRYHPEDLYGKMMEIKVQIFDEEMNFLREEPLYEKFERQVESVGDGTGEFLWPRQQRYDGMWFGFDQAILAQKRSLYLDTGIYRAQYYNNPNDLDGGGINPECFQYYDKSLLKQEMGNWYFKDRRLNIVASIDFAFSLKTQADYTALTVVGMDGYGNYYVLDIDRFKSNLVSEYYQHIWSLYKKWQFHTIVAEVTAAQAVIVEDIKNNYIYKDGLMLSVKEFSPNRSMGIKEERINAVLQPRYANGQIWHYKGGNCQTLEEELILRHPSHDDIKDSLATSIMHLKPPTSFVRRLNQFKDNLVYHARFGGLG